MRQYGIKFPVALDDPAHYRVSNEYRLTTVPTIYLVDRDGKIDLSIVGWSRKDMEELDMKLSMLDSAQEQIPLFKPGEQVAEYKAG
jgi:hypothetical protein